MVTTRSQMEERVLQLEAELKEARAAAALAMTEADTNKKRLKDSMSAWKARLERNNSIVKRYCSERDRQLQEISARLLYVEGLMLHEQKQIVALVQQKDEVIDDQQNAIDELTLKNSELTQALNAAQLKIGRNGYSLTRSDDKSAQLSECKNKHGVTLTVESAQHSSTRYVSRIASMKNRLRKHKSNSDLNQGDATIVEETPEDVSLSQENLASTSKQNRLLFRERCKSIAGYPITELQSLINGVPQGDIPSPTYSATLKVNGDVVSLSGDRRGSSHSTIAESPSNSPQEYSAKSGKKSIKTKSKLASYLSLSSSDLSDSRLSDHHMDVRKSLSALPLPTSQNVSTTGNASESNPFKSIKSIIKRKGSKLKNKKRETSLQQSTNTEFEQALKLNSDVQKVQVKQNSAKSKTIK